jgi:hypothetical protein
MSFSTPIYKVSPQNIVLVVGQSRTVSVTDASGNTVRGLGWRTDDLTVVNLSTDEPPVITALAPGHATVWAGDVPFPVIVYAGDSIPSGAVMWSLPLTSTASPIVNIIPAVPGSDGTDLIVQDSSGNLWGVTADGSLGWGATVDPGAHVVPMFSGNLLVKTPYSFVDDNGKIHFTHKIQSLNPVTGQTTDIYTFASTWPTFDATGNFQDQEADQDMVVHPGNVVFIRDLIDVSPGETKVYLFVFDVGAASEITRTPLPTGTSDGQPVQATGVGPLIVAGDGNAYMAYSTGDATTAPFTTGSPTRRTFPAITRQDIHLVLLRISPDGTFANTTLHTWTRTYSCVDWMPPDAVTYIDGSHCTASGTAPTSYVEEIIDGKAVSAMRAITNADKGATVFATWIQGTGAGVCADFFDAEYFDADGVFHNLSQGTDCPPAATHTDEFQVAQDAVTSTALDLLVMSWADGKVRSFLPALQQEDGSYVGTDTDNNLITVDATAKLWQQTLDPTSLKPLYLTADAEVVASSSTGTLFTVSNTGTLIGQDSGPNPVLSWLGKAYMAATNSITQVYSLPARYAMSFGAVAQGNHSKTEVAVKQQSFAPLQSCSDHKIPCPGPNEAVYAALDWLLSRLQDDCSFCQELIFNRLVDANDVPITKASFISYLTTKKPEFYDGRHSTAKRVGNLYTWNFWDAATDGRTIDHEFALSGPQTDAITCTGCYPLKTFFNATKIDLTNQGVNDFNIGMIFHESLHGITGLVDDQLQRALGCKDTSGDDTHNIADFLVQFVSIDHPPITPATVVGCQ